MQAIGSIRQRRLTELAAAHKHKQSNELLSAGDHDVGATIKSPTSHCRKSLLFALLSTLALFVSKNTKSYQVLHGRETLHEFGAAELPNADNSIHQKMHSDLINVDAAGPHPQRITPLDPKGNFSFVHISKCAGSTWIRLFKKILKLNICPDDEAGVEQSVFYQQQYTCKDADYTLISLRSPRHHVWSQFTMCKYSYWGKKTTKQTNFPRSGNKDEDDEVDFDSWLSHFTANNNTHYYKCYHPANFQTRALTSQRRYVGSGRGGYDPNMTTAMNTYMNLDFVALVEFVHESQCMLYYRLGNKAPPAAISYLKESCHCEKQHEDQKKNGKVHVQHHNMGKRSNLRDLPSATLSKLANLTSADSFIYLNALNHFMDEVAWLESDNALGRRVVCDNVLKKWESELAYLDSGHFNVTQVYRDAVVKHK